MPGSKPVLKYAGSDDDPTSAQSHKHKNTDVLEQITQEMVVAISEGFDEAIGPVITGGKPNSAFSLPGDLLSGGRP